MSAVRLQAGSDTKRPHGLGDFCVLTACYYVSTKLSLEERFTAKVDTSGGPDACWPWTATLINTGYGRIWIAGSHYLAHRVAYELWRGPIPDGLDIDHICHDPRTCAGGDACPHRRCVNPAHLEIVPHRVNLLRGNTIVARNAAKAQCLNGHEFTIVNTRIGFNWDRRSYYRACKQCERERRKTPPHARR